MFQYCVILCTSSSVDDVMFAVCTSRPGLGRPNVKVNGPYSTKRAQAGCSPLLLRRPWARRRINHWSLWRMASATPDLRLPSQPQRVADRLPVPNYTALWQRHMCVNNLPKVVSWKWNGRESNPRPFMLRANTLTITPRPGHSGLHHE